MLYNQINDFDFPLPEHLIAQYPTPERSASRLLTLDIGKQTLLHQQFPDILGWMKAGDLLILNDTKVIPARLFGCKSSGGRVECLIERIISEHEALVHLRVSKPPGIGHSILFENTFSAEVIARQDALFHLKFASAKPLLELLNDYGSIPLPLYFKRQSENLDHERYQTVYARHAGAVAAPTAGLHFDKAILSALQNQGVKIATVTLHIGAGTFQPVRVTDLNQHKMHSEYMELPAATCSAVNDCKARGGRVFAVGTTVTRCLETAAQNGELTAFRGYTDLFIRPGFQFRCVDALLTNFHTPKSTLLMLVAAFAGYEFTMNAYQTAIQNNYRFFSYGDAMLMVNFSHDKM
jgi:S-adenosylmethionine:tRNA ribosyltransferase-isomerase